MTTWLTYLFITLLSVGLSLLYIRFDDFFHQHIPTKLEKTYVQYSERKRLKFDDEEKNKVDLSVVIPAYNEQKRIIAMLSECLKYLEEQNSFSSWEILVVSDGSTDNTTSTVLDWSEEMSIAKNVRVCELEQNCGKGAAVKHGMLLARGRYRIFADADGASKFADCERLYSSLKALSSPEKDESTDQKALGEFGIAIGSRAHLVDTDLVRKRSKLRQLLMYSFHYILNFLGIHSIKDTQCGFKMFTDKTVDLIFPNLHVKGWVFDIEILLLAERKHVPMIEIPINWHEVPESKIKLAKDCLLMATDLLILRSYYFLLPEA